jgi:TRAP transporter 4TM/12TM fusion protein
MASWLREQPKMWLLVSTLALLMTSYHLFTTQVLLLSHWPHLNLHLAFGLLIVFLQAAERSSRARALYFVAAAVSLVVVVYIHIEADDLLDREQMPTDVDFLVGLAILVLVIWAAYLAFGFILPVLALLGIVYALLGPYFPGELFHAGIGFGRLIAMLTTDIGGIYGTLLFISATYMAIFLTLGSFIENSGVAQFFIDFPLALFRGVKAGGGYAAVVASALMGMGSGSPVANVVTTGTFTIPLMKKAGFQAHVAGGIEAAASTGGQLMPPVMGAVAFVMAEFTGVAYVKIIGYATIPAFLFFLTVGFGVYFRSAHLNLKAVPVDDLPELKVMLRGVSNFLPIAVLVGVLVAGYTAALAAFWAVASLMVLILVRNPNMKFFTLIGKCFTSGGRRAAEFAAAMACISIFVKVIMGTGIGLKLPILIEEYAAGNLLMGYVYTALASAVLGMGLPTVAAYIVVAVLAVPALTQMGANMIQAHFFVLYFSILSGLTPPVALAALAGAKVAEANYMKTSWASLQYGLVAFIIPFLFVYNPALMAIGSLGAVLMAVLGTLLGCIAIAAFLQGYLLRRTTWLGRGLMGLAAAASFGFVVTTQFYYLLAGLVLFAVVFLKQGGRAVLGFAKAPEEAGAPIIRN